MKIRINYRPTEKQGMYHSSTADEVLYGGAAGGGKSKATVMEALQLCLEHPNTNAYLFRKTYPELRDTLIAEAMNSIPKEIGKYNDSKKTYFLINGSELRFRYCQSENDRFKYQGAEIHWLFIDELTHFSKTVYDYLKTRLRANKRLGIKPKVRCTSNPGGVGHGWVKAYFIDIGEPFKIHERQIESKTLGKTQIKKIQYIPAYATDNPHITDDYIFELEQKPEALKKALLFGDWNVFEGQVFTEWMNSPNPERRYTHVIEPFRIPDGWHKFRSFDYGYSRPFSVGWWAVDYDGRLYRYREWYGCTGEPNVGLKLSPTEIAKGIKEREAGDGNIIGFADPSIWSKDRGESVADIMLKEGVTWLKADNDRLNGKMQVHNRLKFDENGIPMLYVFSTCKDSIRTIPNLPYSETKVEDIDTDAEDHAYDDWRYALMSRPYTPSIPIVKKQIPYPFRTNDENQGGFMTW
ncbi:phage terminase large subunit [Fictibacillus gelatini]|uniref:phage terminase large subunit n=1 Tax=Fictibacillus gelatini TaxID=225985 RepID=UPI0004130EC4|nr:phage terminase large subunit [Fictibacillus gelatini]